jgi:intracellular multiplication protein IcmT
VAHWRDSARNVTFWIVDFRACFPLLVFLLHIKIWTFFLAIFFVSFFVIIQYYGFTVNVFLRWIRAFLAGPRKIAQPWWRR